MHMTATLADAVASGPHISYSNMFGTSFGSNRDVFPVRSVPLNAFTEEAARKFRYMVQTSSPSEHNFWYDTWCDKMQQKHSSLHTHSKMAASSDGSDEDDNDGEEKYVAGFPGKNIPFACSLVKV
jgi:hypothetical protein